MQSQLQLYLKKLFIPLCLNLYLQLIKVFEFYTFIPFFMMHLLHLPH